MEIFIQMMRHHLKYLGFKFHLSRLNHLDTLRDYVKFQLPIPYCVSLIMVTITSHIFINIFQMVHFSAVKFTRGNEKNMNFLLIPKSTKVWKKLTLLDRAPLALILKICHTQDSNPLKKATIRVDTPVPKAHKKGGIALTTKELGQE